MKESYQFNDQQYTNKINMLKSIKTDNSAFIKWNDKISKWESVSTIVSAKPYQAQTIKTLSFNVLFDRISRNDMQHVLNSKQRFAYTLQKLGQIKPDIIGLQQVTKIFFQMLLECDWAKKYYWVSNYKDYAHGFGNLILTKIQPICIEIIKVNRLPRYVCTAFIPIYNKLNKQVDIIAFSSIHLIALDKNHEIRNQQMGDLIQKLKKYEKIVSDFVLQGDLNLHAQFQTQNITKHGLKDCWLQKYDNDLKKYPGFTFDSNYNSLINQIYWGFQRRRMRLDRIFILGNVLFTKNIQIILNQAINGQKKQVDNYWYLKGGLLFATDKLGFNLRKNNKQYLCASDHFALLADLQIKSHEKQQKKLIN